MLALVAVVVFVAAVVVDDDAGAISLPILALMN